jgi:hypothetical protein
LRLQCEQLQEITGPISPCASNLMRPQWQLPLWIIRTPIVEVAIMKRQAWLVGKA